MSTQTKVTHVNLSDMMLKRIITEAIRLKISMKGDLDKLDALNKEIKHELLNRVGSPGDSLTVVSGEGIASLSAEKKGRDVNIAVRHIIMEEQGLSKFLEMVTIPMATLKKAYTEDALEALAPAEYSGAGRAYKLGERS